MQLEDKKQFIKGFSQKLKDAKSIILVQYQGLNVENITELRSKLKEVDCTMRVIKNKLAIRAIDASGIKSYASIKDFFKGPIAVLIGDEDPSAAIKIFKKYADENKLMEFKAAVITDNFFDGQQVGKIAELPSREVMLAKTVMMINAPIQGLHNALSGVLKKLLYALNSLKDKIDNGEKKPDEVSKQEESSVEEVHSEDIKKVEAKEEDSSDAVTNSSDSIEQDKETESDGTSEEVEKKSSEEEIDKK